MCNRIFERAAGIQLRYIPFNSGGEVITALLGGHTELSWANPSEFFPQWEAKLVRPLVVAKETRLSKFSDVPTFKERKLDVTFRMFEGTPRPGDLPAVAGYYEM
jgi:putative tricarboxylic transport membrane protein